MYRNRYCLVIDSALDVLQLVPEILERDRLTGFYGAVEDCLIADNSVSDEVLAQTEADSADLHINGCTIAGNTVGATSTIFAPGIFTLYNSIIDQPGRTTVDPL